MPPHRRVLRGPALIRPATDADASSIIALIWRCWSDYSDVASDVDRTDPELRAPASHFLQRGGRLWVAPGIAGVVGVLPTHGAVWEICRMYAHPSIHGTGLGHALLNVAEGHATARGAVRLVLWSDTLFLRAHRFYEKRGYRRSGEPRSWPDGSGIVEYGYSRPVRS